MLTLWPLALLAGVVVFLFSRPTYVCGSEKGAARNGARMVYQNSQVWVADHPEGGCPSVNDLVVLRAIDPASTITDPWQRPYLVACTNHDGLEVEGVFSAGPDRQFGTNDDIVIPDGFSADFSAFHE